MSRRRLLVLSGLVAALVLAVAAPAAAHAELAGSQPVDGSTVTAAPSVVTLRFEETSTAASARWTLAGPDGRQVADLGLAPGADDDGETFQVAVPAGLADGTYTLGWDGLVTAEGHAVSGRIRFSVGAPSAGVDAGPAGGTSGTSLAAGFEQATDAAKALWYLAFSLTAGGLVLLVAIRRGASDRPGVGPLALAGRTVLWWGALALTALTAVRFGLLVTAFGDGSPDRTAWTAALDARAGSLGLKALAVAPAALYVAALARRDRRLGDAVPVAGLLVLLGLMEVAAGHAGTGDRRASAVLVTTLHLLGAAVWLGPLLAVLLVPVAARRPWRDLTPADRRAGRVGFLRDFAPLGATAFGAVLVTGVVTAHDRTGWRFWDGDYGRTLVLKLALVGAVIVPLAALHRRRVWQADVASVDGPPLRRTFRLEVAALVAVVVAAAVLTGQDPTPTARPEPGVVGGRAPIATAGEGSR